MPSWFDAHRATALTITLAASLLASTGCATSGNPRDPIEGFNRAMFDLNDGLDKALVKPVAQGYESALPAPVRKGVSNFFGNLGEVFIAANNVLQGKLPEAASDVGRFAINTTIGVLGIVDVASSLGLEKHEEDFGQTFGRWGFGNGPYLVLPFFGPSTLRDATGLAVDLHVDPLGNYSDVPARNIMIATRTLNDRAGLLPVDKIVDEAALDRYAYIRDAYLQRRRSQVYDGDAPREDDNAAATLTPPTTLLLARANAALPQRERVQGSVNLYVEWPTETPAATVMARPAPLLTDPLVLAQIH
ncbi:MAG: VacJ family lipoprotein [Sterolibacterium sp.]|nr:VacJ family lipoprotein [Sterolibacterium sp.]